jgi:hypothetical protein
LNIDTASLKSYFSPSKPREWTFDWAALPNTGGYLLQIDTSGALFSQPWYEERVFESHATKIIPPIDTNKIYWRVKALGPGACSDGQWYPRTLTDVDESGSTMLPSRYVLFQSFPNPFNPTTTITFSLPQESYVSLKVFDVLGREVTTLVNRKLSAGNHSQNWNPIGAPSGLYFYRLQAGGFTQTKKLLLLR